MTKAESPDLSTARSPGDARRRPSTALWWLAGVYAAAAAAAYVLFVRTGAGQRLDEAGLFGRDSVRPGFGDAAGSLLGGIEVTALLGAAALIGTVAFVRGRGDLAAVVLAVIVGSNLTTQVLKNTVLERPHLIPDAYRLVNSYPSGHVTAIASLAIAAVLVMPSRVRSAVGVLGTGSALAVGLATVAAGWHRPADVMGAWLVVGVWAALATALVFGIRGTGSAVEVGRGAVALEGLLWVFAGGALAAFFGSAGAWVGLHWADAADVAVVMTRRGLALTAAVAGMIGTAAVVTASIVTATRRSSLAPEWLGRR